MQDTETGVRGVINVSNVQGVGRDVIVQGNSYADADPVRLWIVVQEQFPTRIGIKDGLKDQENLYCVTLVGLSHS